MKIDFCPFCGGKAKLVILSHENGDTTQWHKIMCENVFECGANLGTAISKWQNNYNECVEQLIKRWNRRISNE